MLFETVVVDEGDPGPTARVDTDFGFAIHALPPRAAAPVRGGIGHGKMPDAGRWERPRRMGGAPS